jgi:predicted O-methyltransferase YrrM
VSEETWDSVDDYVVTRLGLSDASLAATLERSDEAGLPKINVAPNQGKLLELLARSHGARRILEIGTLGGYSTIWMARALPSDGVLVTLELSPVHAEVARTNLEGAGVASKVEVRVGPAADTLRAMIDERVEPFDFIFIDADKEGYPEYFALSMQLSRPGTVMVADNVVRNGAVADPTSADERVRAVQQFFDDVAAEPRVDATAVQTVGTKGYDGFALLIVNE